VCYTCKRRFFLGDVDHLPVISETSQRPNCTSKQHCTAFRSWRHGQVMQPAAVLCGCWKN
jgi:hypothetical protein